MSKHVVENKLRRKRTTRASHRDACPLCEKYTQWKPAVLKSIEEGRRFSDDLASGRVTREELIRRGELMTCDEFIRQLKERCKHVSC